MLAAGPPLGRVITFYSYKGGTGRSMALANAAFMLAANGQRVLAIDWDLEAPGLQRYFQPYLRDPKLEASDGLMDFVLAFADAARFPASEPDGTAVQTGAETWFERYADLRMVAYAVNWSGFAERGGRLDFVPAGRQDAGYSLRVNSFNWQHFYSKLGGGIFLEAVKRRLRAEYDYVLIDSRTGVSDTSGVCTVQMPDTLVVCFTLNEQSIHGAGATAASAHEQRRTPDGTSSLRVMPVPTRVDSSEKERVDAARAAARARFDRFMDWLDEDQLDEYWGDVETPYIPFYSLEEVLAVFDRPRVRTSLLPAVEGLVSWLSEQRITGFPVLEEAVRKQELARFLRAVAPQGPPPDPKAPAGEIVFFVNYARRDADATLREFLDELSDEVRSVTGVSSHEVMFLDQRDLDAGADWSSTLKSAVNRSSTVLCLVSPGWVNSAPAGEELLYARQQGKPVLPIEWVPVMETLPPTLQGVTMQRAPSRGGYRYLARDGKGPEYRRAIYELANRIASAWQQARGAASASPPAPGPAPVLAPDPDPDILVPIVAERSRVMRLAFPTLDNYGLRRRDWVPFPGQSGQKAGDTVLAVAAECGAPVRLVSLHRFRDWIADDSAPGAALVVIDARTAERPEYERQLLEWDRKRFKRAQAIVCVPGENDVETYRRRYEGLASAARPVAVIASAPAFRNAIAAALAGLSG